MIFNIFKYKIEASRTEIWRLLNHAQEWTTVSGARDLIIILEFWRAESMGTLPQMLLFLWTG